MTRRDYELLVRAFRKALAGTHNPAGKNYISFTAEYVGLELAADNPRFDIGRFRREINA